MSTPFDEPIPPTPVTAQAVTDWLAMMKRQRFPLYTHIKNGQVPEATFWTMAILLQDAMEKVRVLSATLGERSPLACTQATELRSQATQLREDSAVTRQTWASFSDPSPTERHGAESQLLESFTQGGVYTEYM